jgi:hypothetical protein
MTDKLNFEDCPRKFTAIRYNSRISEGTWRYYNTSSCEHEHWTADETENRITTRTTLVGSTFRLFMGPAVDGIQGTKYMSGIAYCDVCDYKFRITRDFRNVWRDRVQVQEYADWEVVRGKDGNPLRVTQ